MSCACIKGYFDFHLVRKRSDLWVYTDVSLWMDGQRYSGEKIYNVNLENIITGKEFIISAKGHDSVVVEDELKDGVFRLRVVNCDTPYSRYGVSVFQIDEIIDNLIITNYIKYKEEILELFLLRDRLRIKVNNFKNEQDEQSLINEYNKLLDFATLLKCKL